MKFAADLHIHSALSPCSDDDMTPNNILRMAALKKLDIIAITDHNSAENLESFIRCGYRENILVVPGMEVETAEEVHLLCYFPSAGAAVEIQRHIYENLPDMRNREDIFGRQLLLDDEDNITGRVERMLLTAANIGIEDITAMVRDAGGAVVPAHVDRESYSILSNLGIIPGELGFNYLELSRQCSPRQFAQDHPVYTGMRFLQSSDAHHLWDILERESFLDLEKRTLDCFLRHLSEG